MSSLNQLVQPTHLQIERGLTIPVWPNIPREVGDGMESDQSRKLTKHIAEQEYSQKAYTTHRTSYATKKEHPIHSKSVAVQVDGDARNDDVFQSGRFLSEEKAILKDHLQIQIQVNQELKKLLVASVGEDLAFHYDRLVAENAQLLMEIDQWKRKCESEEEELERLEITCDVWRSKFLASRMQCDDMVAWKRTQERIQRGMENGARALLREHWERSEYLESLHKTLSRVSCALRCDRKLDPATKDISVASTNVARKCRDLAGAISDHLLGMPLTPLPSEGIPLHEACNTPTPTPAEKYVLQVGPGPVLARPDRNKLGPDEEVHLLTPNSIITWRVHDATCF